jgi:hypothetical protein
MFNNCQNIGLVALLCLFSSLALGQGSSFSTTVGTAVLCLDDLDPGFLYNYMAQLKPAYKREEGAYWFKAETDMFGVPVTEVFVSDGSSAHNFVGVLSSLPPDQIVEAVGNGAPAGGVFIKDHPADRYSTYSSASGSVIAFQGKNGKIYCRRDRLKD